MQRLFESNSVRVVSVCPLVSSSRAGCRSFVDKKAYISSIQIDQQQEEQEGKKDGEKEKRDALNYSSSVSLFLESRNRK